MAAVTAAGVHREFGGREVLRGLDLSLEDGEFVALLGRSGTGKSTLLRILCGLGSSYAGDVLVPERRAVVFQEPRLIPWQRVLPNVSLGLSPRAAGGRDGLRRLCLRHRPAVLLVTHDVEEAIGLADRVLVLAGGVITFAAPVTLGRLRDPADPGFLALRARLLAELGVPARARGDAAGQRPM